MVSEPSKATFSVTKKRTHLRDRAKMKKIEMLENKRVN